MAKKLKPVATVMVPWVKRYSGNTNPLKNPDLIQAVLTKNKESTFLQFDFNDRSSSTYYLSNEICIVKVELEIK